jgi:hypothetical protein
MITEDDGDMIARMVQDCLAKDFDHATHHRDKLQKELAEMEQFLKKLREVQIAGSRRRIDRSTPQTDKRVKVEEQDPIQSLPHTNTTVYIIPSMLCMDEIVWKTPLKDLNHIQLVLMWMPSRSLHKLQVSIDHKVQSRAHRNLVELQ